MQDYNVARECFERALVLGENKACYWLALQYLSGDGVRRSTEKALELLKKGGDSGDFECFEMMWRIYSGQMAADDFIHKENADLCYGRYLKKLAISTPSNILADYLNHSYDSISKNYSEKFPLLSFPGKHFPKTLDILSDRARAGIKIIRHARILEIGLDERDELTDGKADLIFLEMFLSDKTSDGYFLMRKTMAEIEKADIEYCFSNTKNPAELVKTYMKYLSRPELKEDNKIVTSSADTPDGAPTSGVAGFFRRLFS